MIRAKPTAPQAAVLVWNYKDRMAQPLGASSSTQDTEPLYIASASVRSIRTQKSKSSPAGSFTIELAPTYNWIAKITVGSWLAILMTQDQLIDPSTVSGKARQDQLKMLGRVDSVRQVVTVNQETGARQTGFVITGRDWASIFECTMYIDPLVPQAAEKVPTAANAVTFSGLILNYEKSAENSFLFSSTEIVKAIKRFFGQVPGGSLSSLQGSDEDGPWGKMALIPHQVFHIPQSVSEYFGFSAVGSSTNIDDIIEVVDGRLSGYDTYDMNQRESVGLPNLLAACGGTHTYWQLLVEHSNPVLNELVAEIRWESDPSTLGGFKPKLALYKRIKPFTISTPSLLAQIQSATSQGDPSVAMATTIIPTLVSEFRNVKRTEISLEDVLMIDAGTNWRDKINFIEILVEDTTVQKYSGMINSQIKPWCRIIDENAASREGLKPLLLRTNFFPPPEEIGALDIPHNIPAVASWKHLLRSWYFDTHNMLNGSVTLIGQNNYIGVGENILIPAKALGINPIFFKGMSALPPETINNVYLLAHVESVTHQFSVTEEGARSFSTIVQFVRGIFTDKSGINLNIAAMGAIDASSTAMEPNDERLPNVVRTSTPLDTDKNSQFKGQ